VKEKGIDKGQPQRDIKLEPKLSRLKKRRPDTAAFGRAWIRLNSAMPSVRATTAAMRAATVRAAATVRS